MFISDFDLLPLDSFAAQTFGDRAVGNVVGHNYADQTVTLYVWDPVDGSSEERIVHVKGLVPAAEPTD